jgi:hypothetical protein
VRKFGSEALPVHKVYCVSAFRVAEALFRDVVVTACSLTSRWRWDGYKHTQKKKNVSGGSIK